MYSYGCSNSFLPDLLEFIPLKPHVPDTRHFSGNLLTSLDLQQKEVSGSEPDTSRHLSIEHEVSDLAIIATGTVVKMTEAAVDQVFEHFVRVRRFLDIGGI